MTQFRVFTRWVRACADLSPSNYGGPWDQTGRNIEHELAVQFQNSYFPVSEYPQKTGWGHGTFDSAPALAKRVSVRHLYCTHHLPSRRDDELEAVFAAFLSDHAAQLQGLDITFSDEGLDVTS